MTGRSRARRRPSGSDQGAHWISYSDMMASLLIVFVLAVVYSVYQYYQMLELKTQQLNAQQTELDKAMISLVEREEEVETLNVTLMGKQEELATIQIQLDEQKDELFAAQTALKTKEEEQAALQLQLLAQQDQLAEQTDKLNAMQVVLQAQKTEMLNQQKRLDDLVGVKTKIIQDLTLALNRANLKATVDKDTGDIVLDSAVFFDVNSNTIKDSGQQLLARFLPVYLSVLMSEEYVDYVGEIVIEGHTDTAGSYMTNLKLSQNRALSVAEYCMQLPGLSSRQIKLMQELMTAKGRSFSDPVYNADGTVNMDASRRVEFKFRLKDSEMIDEMNRILSEME